MGIFYRERSLEPGELYQLLTLQIAPRERILWCASPDAARVRRRFSPWPRKGWLLWSVIGLLSTDGLKAVLVLLGWNTAPLAIALFVLGVCVYMSYLLRVRAWKERLSDRPHALKGRRLLVALLCKRLFEYARRGRYSLNNRS